MSAFKSNVVRVVVFGGGHAPIALFVGLFSVGLFAQFVLFVDYDSLQPTDPDIESFVIGRHHLDFTVRVH